MFYNFVKGLIRFLMFFFIRIESVGAENVISEGGVIYAANHKAWLDPFVVAATSPRNLTFMAKKELFENKILGFFLKKMGSFPVNRGKGDLAAVKTALTILKEGKVMMIFPEGTRVKKGESVAAKPGVAMFATHAKVPIIPINISGDYGFMKKITVFYGKPVSFEEYYGQKLPTDKLKELSQELMDNIYALEATK